MSFIVGIGASAGGLDAIEKFFKNMPSRDDISFVVIQHLSPDYKSMMGELLTKFTSRNIFIAENGMKVIPGSIYLIPPRKRMTILSNTLYIDDYSKDEVLHLPIDDFLRSLAEDQREKSIGIILSGTGSDGTKGVISIKKNGGFVMVQDAKSAQFASMPVNASNTGLIDYVLKPEEMGEKLAEYLEINKISETLEDTSFGNSNDSLLKIYRLIEEEIDLNLTYYKQNTLSRRLERRMSVNQIKNIEEYYLFLKKSSDELKKLCDDVLIGVTQFFRDIEAFEYVKNKVIPDIVKNKDENDTIRVWVTGCSTGEEAYSLAILLYDYLRKENFNHHIKIFASDIDKKVLNIASTGVYNQDSVSAVPEELLHKYFVQTDTGYKVCKEIRDMIIFSKHNLITDPPFNKIDLLSCRNLLIYLQPILQRKVIGFFNYAINKDGYLFLGSSESIGEFSNMFISEEPNLKIYKHKEIPRVPKFEFDPLSIKSLSGTQRKERIDKTGSKQYWDELYRALVHEYMPATVVVDSDYNVLLASGKASKYLSIPKGLHSANIIDMIAEKAITPLTTALRYAFDKDMETHFVYEIKKDEGTAKKVEVHVARIIELRSFSQLSIVSFKEINPEEKETYVIQTAAEFETNKRIKELEQDLQYSRENLQSTVEELETSNEELQVTNEELLSSNEELQSTNEELQAVNEELVELNSEYQMRINELSDLNNDMDNFLSSTDIGVLFLDRDLKIRKFTNAAARVINLMSHDIDRPIAHISHNLKDIDIVYEAGKVLETLVPVEKEILKNNNEVYILKIHPYRTREDFIKGVTITLVNITELKNLQRELKDIRKKK